MADPKQMTKRNPGAAIITTTSLVVFALSLAKAQLQEVPTACPPPKSTGTPSVEMPFGSQGSVKAESMEWRVELVRTGPGSGCPRQFLFKVRNQPNGAVSQFTLCDQTLQIDKVVLIKPSKALILGRAGHSSWIANVVELPSGKIVDHFTPFRPVVSPGSRFLAYLKDFPPHPGPVTISQEYVVYDLSRSAEDNRPRFKPEITYDAGWPVYPPGAKNAPGENVLPEGSPAHILTSASLFWLDNYRLAFTDFFQGQNTLVVVNLSRGVGDASVHTLPLDPDRLVDLDQCKKSTAPSDFEVWSKQPAGLISVEQIDRVSGKPGMACLYFVPSPCLRQTNLMVKLR